MYIHRALLLIFLALYIFTPPLQAWITENSTAWYRPYLPWLGIILFVYWTQRTTRLKKQ